MPARSIAAGARSCSAKSRARVSGRNSGVSPQRTRTSSISPCGESRPLIARNAARTASPVPSGGSCTTVSAGATVRATASICGPITTTIAAGASGCTACNRYAIIGCPAIGCITLGRAEFIRVPLPAARMMVAKRDWLIAGSNGAETGAATPSRGTPLFAPKDLLQRIARQRRVCSNEPVLAHFRSRRHARRQRAGFAAAPNEMLRQRGHPPLSLPQVKQMVGDGTPTMVARALAARGTDQADAGRALPRFLEIYEANAVRLTRPYPDAPQTLTPLRRRGYRTAICTNKPQRATIALIEGLGLNELFDAIAGGDRFPVKKPDPGHLLGLIGELGVRVEASAMIGDNENDAAAARAAGGRLVLMRYGYARVRPRVPRRGRAPRPFCRAAPSAPTAP